MESAAKTIGIPPAAGQTRQAAVPELSGEAFRALAEEQPNLCWMAHRDGSIYWYNKRWYDYTGTTLEQMQGWGWQSVHDPQCLPAVMQRWRETLAAGSVMDMTFPLRGADGVFRPFLTRIVPVRDASGAITRWFGSNVDISEQQATETALRASEEALRRLNEQLGTRIAEEVAAREQAQQRLAQAQRMEALGQLAGGIAHDFNNVLQAVSGGLGLIQKRAEDAEMVRQLARMAADAAGRGAAITGRLLAFARRGELRASTVPTLPLLHSLREILASTLGAGITVRIESDAMPPPLLADRAQLETVLINLAVNARDAMPAGGLLSLSGHAETVVDARHHAGGLQEGAYVRLGLEDTGVGMDAATLARAAEPFFTTKPAGQGTGLGLAMARGFAQQSGGGFRLRSVPGQGTTVTLWFPQAPAAPSEAGAAPPAAATAGRPGARVLVVDDDAMVRQVLAGQLDALGYRVSHASDGLSALARLDAGEPVDLLVTDLSMPGMNGMRLIEEARQRLPSLPALLLTGYADARVQLDASDAAGAVAGADGRTVLLHKPVAADELAERAATLLRGAPGFPRP